MLLQKQAVIRDMVTGSWRVFEEMSDALESLRIRPAIDAAYAFEDALKAYEHLHRGAFGKIVIRVGK